MVVFVCQNVNYYNDNMSVNHSCQSILFAVISLEDYWTKILRQFLILSLIPSCVRPRRRRDRSLPSNRADLSTRFTKIVHYFQTFSYHLLSMRESTLFHWLYQLSYLNRRNHSCEQTCVIAPSQNQVALKSSSIL